MLDLLKARQGVGVSNLVDMIYAHVGIASDGANFTVDYSKPYPQLYQEFAAYVLKHYSKFNEYLSLVNHSSSLRPDGMSSWAVDWTTEPSILSNVYPPPQELAVLRRFIETSDSPVFACIGLDIGNVMKATLPINEGTVQHAQAAAISSELCTLKYIYRGYILEKDEELFHSVFTPKFRKLCLQVLDAWAPWEIIVAF
jgi:hypothetical protein